MKKAFLSVLICMLVISSFCFVGCKKKNDLNDISKNLTEYNMDISLDVDNKAATIKQTVNYVNTSGVVLKNVCFHLYPQFFKEGATNYIVPSTKMNVAYPNGMDYAKFGIQRVEVDEKDCVVKFLGECDSILDVPLNASLLPQDSVQIKIEYSLTLPNCRHRFGYGNNTINLANFYPVACVYENGGFNMSPYNANGDPFYSNLANYQVNISLDKNYTLASTGNSTQTKVDEKLQSISCSALAVRDFAMVVSNKFKCKQAKADGVDVEYFYFDDNYADQALQTGVDAIKTFSNKFGSYPYNKFTIVKTDFIQGGMEYPNLVMISSDISTLEEYLYVIVHETAHQWWYGVVGNDEFKYPWLDEALAEFSSVLFFDYNKGYNSTHKQLVDVNRENYSLFITVYEEVLGEIDTSMRAVDLYDTEPEYTYCVYVKGVLMYESLYNLIGEKDFIKGLKIYYDNCRFSNATPQQLIDAFESASNMPLKNFFESWINGKVVIK